VDDLYLVPKEWDPATKGFAVCQGRTDSPVAGSGEVASVLVSELTAPQSSGSTANAPVTAPLSVLSKEEVLADAAVRKVTPYTIAGQAMQWVEWENICVLPPDMMKFQTAYAGAVCHGQNAIDIGAHSGDSPVSIALSTQGGEVYAYEPHPKTFHILQLNARLNPALRITPFNVALMLNPDEKMWWVGNNNGCNGEITSTSCGVQHVHVYTCTALHTYSLHMYVYRRGLC